MKNTKRIFIIAFLLCIFTYCCKIDSIPKKIILYGGENLNIGNFLGISLKVGNQDCQTILASSNITQDINLKNKEISADVKLFNKLNVKEVSINIIDKTTVIPVGQVSGLKLYTNGVLVVGMSEIKGKDGISYKPYEGTEIQEGDRITKIDDKEVTDTNGLINIVNKSNGKSLQMEYVRNGEINRCEITPIQYTDNTYKLGLWVRDSAAGIGTLTFYEPSTGNFAALGHGITDSDTGNLIEIQNGEFLTTKVLSIEKGLKRQAWKNTGNYRKWNNNRNNI